jgi:tRNA A58 N-methylase Trm61
MIEYFKQFKVGSGCCYEDYAFLYGLVAHIRPKRVIEIGTNMGVSAIAMAKAMKDFNINGQVDTFELSETYARIAGKQAIKAGLERWISGHCGNYEDYPFINNVEFDLAFVDGDHSLEGTLRDYHLLKGKTRYLIFHDVHAVDGKRQAFEQILGEKLGFFNCEPGTISNNGVLKQNNCFNGMGLIKGDLK